MTARTLFVASGRDVANHARDIAKHFATEGTPVMIGILLLHHFIMSL
jgi:hypothetical protein